MPNESQHREDIPLTSNLEESYWAILLNDNNYAEPVTDHQSSENDFPPYDFYTPTPYDVGPLSLKIEDTSTTIWKAIQQLAEADEVVECIVVSSNRGGLLVEWESLRGFVPASQLIDFPTTSHIDQRRNALNDHIGKKLLLRVIELDVENNRLILSERAARANPGERAGILYRLKEGDVIQGVVTNLCDFGVFVDLGGLEGLIHISELSWGRVNAPSEFLKAGQKVEVYVLNVNHQEERIALSIKRLFPDPWIHVHEKYHINQVITVKITNVVDFGAFARIEKGLEGLIHVSELAEGQFLHPRNVVQEGQIVQARVLSIDGQARRLGLSLRIQE